MTFNFSKARRHYRKSAYKLSLQNSKSTTTNCLKTSRHQTSSAKFPFPRGLRRSGTPTTSRFLTPKPPDCQTWRWIQSQSASSNRTHPEADRKICLAVVAVDGAVRGRLGLDAAEPDRPGRRALVFAERRVSATEPHLRRLHPLPSAHLLLPTPPSLLCFLFPEPPDQKPLTDPSAANPSPERLPRALIHIRRRNEGSNHRPFVR